MTAMFTRRLELPERSSFSLGAARNRQEHVAPRMFVGSRGNKAIGIEAKATERWRPEDGRALRTALSEKLIQKAFAVYLGNTTQLDDGIQVLPIAAFARALANGDIL